VIAGLIGTAQADLDTITGANGVTLATTQSNYAPNKVVPDAAGVAPTAAEIVTALMADKSCNNGSSITFASQIQIITAAVAGRASDGDSSDYNFGDIDDDAEVFALTKSDSTPYRSVVVA
ncbi:MAG: hypothetical protein GY869_03205, partial [Planctomycetes bacterium]|nr:hypothetical protein [Planctomycetota bacterium]